MRPLGRASYVASGTRICSAPIASTRPGQLGRGTCQCARTVPLTYGRVVTEQERAGASKASSTDDAPVDPTPAVGDQSVARHPPDPAPRKEASSTGSTQAASKDPGNGTPTRQKRAGEGTGEGTGEGKRTSAQTVGYSEPIRSDTKRRRELDLIVYGATGFAGSLVANYLAENAPANVRIGLAGRSEQKLKAVQSEIGGRAESWPVLAADSTDQTSLNTMAGSTKAIISTVGPYAQYGLPLVEACARAGTHYADLAGEVLFMRDSIDRFDKIARQSGARIVHSCGFDSIPSDLGVLALHLAANLDDGQGHLGQTEMVVTHMRGGLSGGTIASGMGEMDRIRTDKRARRVAGDPHSLSPNRDDEPDSTSDRELRGVDYHDVVDSYVAPFMMAGVNSRVVRRSNTLQNWAYGRNFHYRESLATGSGLAGRLKAAAIAAGSTAAFLVLATPPARKVASRFLPDPGEGPDKEKREKGSFEIQIHTRTDSGVGYRCRVSAQGDPGYAATSVMLSQSGLALAGDDALLPATEGVLTPATGLGPHMIDRLRAVGFTISASRS